MLKRSKELIYLVLTVFILHLQSQAQKKDIKNNYRTETGIPRLTVERSMIYIPDTAWMYSHHPSVTRFKDKFIVIWSNGLKDEDNPGQKVAFATSVNFVKWSAVKTLAIPSATNGIQNVLTAAGFHQYSDTLVAYYGEYTRDKKQTHLWAKTTTDGENWSEPIDMHTAVNPNHGPQAINNGRLIISGNFTFPYTGDKRGLTGWHTTSFYPDSFYTEDNPDTFYAPAEKSGLPPLCEGSFFQTDDDVLHMLMRVTGDGWKGRLWLTESHDNGNSWSFPVETSFSDNDSKFHFGRLPDKRFYYVGIPDTLHHYARTPLVLSISKDGKTFGKHYIIADEPYRLKKEGLWKGGQYGYPHTIVYDEYMYVIVSRQKEAVELLRFKIPDEKPGRDKSVF